MGILDDLIRDLCKLTKDEEERVAEHGTPLTGEQATLFIANIGKAFDKAGDALDNELFDGITGTVLTPPGAQSQISWWANMAQQVEDLIVDPPSPPTPADKQTSANNLATMHDPARKQGVIDESTQSAAAAA
jgi:hypothetical protein